MTEHEIRVEIMLQHILQALAMVVTGTCQNVSNCETFKDIAQKELKLCNEMVDRMHWQIMRDNEEEDENYNTRP